MTSKDVARELAIKWQDKHVDMPQDAFNDLVKYVEKALKAHGEAEYARGLEEAAQIVQYSPDMELSVHTARKIRALKPKEDGRG